MFFGIIKCKKYEQLIKLLHFNHFYSISPWYFYTKYDNILKNLHFTPKRGDAYE